MDILLSWGTQGNLFSCIDKSMKNSNTKTSRKQEAEIIICPMQRKNRIILILQNNKSFPLNLILSALFSKSYKEYIFFVFLPDSRPPEEEDRLEDQAQKTSPCCSPLYSLRTEFYTKLVFKIVTIINQNLCPLNKD